MMLVGLCAAVRVVVLVVCKVPHRSKNAADNKHGELHERRGTTRRHVARV